MGSTAPPWSRRGADELSPILSLIARLMGLRGNGVTRIFVDGAVCCPPPLYRRVLSLRPIHIATGTSDANTPACCTNAPLPPVITRTAPCRRQHWRAGRSVRALGFRRARRSTSASTRRLGHRLHGGHDATSDPRTNSLCCQRHLDVTRSSNALVQRSGCLKQL